MGSSKSPVTILSAGSPVAAWLPIICNVFAGVDRQGGDWQVDVAVTAGAESISVAEPMLLKDPLWSQSRFEKLEEPLD